MTLYGDESHIKAISRACCLRLCGFLLLRIAAGQLRQAAGIGAIIEVDIKRQEQCVSHERNAAGVISSKRHTDVTAVTFPVYLTNCCHRAMQGTKQTHKPLPFTRALDFSTVA